MKKLVRVIAEWVASLALIGSMIGPIIILVVLLKDVEKYEGLDIFKPFIVAAIVALGCFIVYKIFNGYVIRHCKRCGKSLKGASYSYEETGRSASTNQNGKVSVSSRVRFDYTCPHCGKTSYDRKQFKSDDCLDDRVQRYCDKRFGA